MQNESIQSIRLKAEVWDRRTYGVLRGPVLKLVSRNDNGTFRSITNRSPERPVGRGYRIA